MKLRQQLRFDNNILKSVTTKASERHGKSLQTLTTKVCNRRDRSLSTSTTKVCNRRGKNLKTPSLAAETNFAAEVTQLVSSTSVTLKNGGRKL